MFIEDRDMFETELGKVFCMPWIGNVELLPAEMKLSRLLVYEDVRVRGA
jgi:hypothetical protein